jgi:hypothetical protein
VWRHQHLQPDASAVDRGDGGRKHFLAR